ncbi:dihydrofolate reductase family protein [Chitinophaga deserti]|uniref:dihydrofolate reductase family protein n=1 Tax=Chitinophaga deserti TaxID=2164099 RepID=UPI000D6AA9A3|nr:dihydrofolate reductase family protein [Chitinophaga deserti]
MRKLKLQMQMTIDGFVAGPEGQLDWMWLSGDLDPTGLQKVIDLADSCDTLLMGRGMSRGFIDYWEKVVDTQPDCKEYPLATRMVDLHKIVFSHSQKDIKGRNSQMENGDLATVVKALKETPGKDIMVYGGAKFASSLISLNLVDEFYFFRNPVAIGKGMPIFSAQKPMKLAGTTEYKSGKILEHYLPG